jgi:ABC-2 type transport system ATP-binding protein
MSAMQTVPAIELDGVSKRFASTNALCDVSIALGRSVTGLLGPNGAGKTTMLRIAATVLAPDEGRVRLLGRDSSRSTERCEIRRRLGYMPQEPGFYRSFTAFEFVDYVAVLKELPGRRPRHDEVRRVLHLVGLEAVMGRRVKALSGGMRRRLALAQALLGNPDLLVLDEPTAGLDPEQRLRFRELVSQLPNRPAVLISTHQTEDVTALCDHVVVLAGGTVRFEGSPGELTATAGGRVWVDEARDHGARLAWRTVDGTVRQIGEPPAGAQLVAPTIDDAYLLLVDDVADAGRVR